MIDGHIDEPRMTDKEIIRALECCVRHDNCKMCPMYDGTDDVCPLTSEMILDLINRQKEQINGLIAAQETLQKHLVEKNTEIERLTEENEILSQKRANIFEITNAYERGRAESIAEFWIKVRAYAVAMGCYHIVEYGDGVVKEIDGGKL